MQPFNGSLIRQFPSIVTGNAAAGILVTVINNATAEPATLYEFDDEAGAQLDNPIATSSTGFYSFYAPNGNYTLQFNSTLFPDLQIQLNDLSAFGGAMRVIKTDAESFSVDINDNETMFVCENNSLIADALTTVTVGEAVTTTGQAAAGAIIIFTQIFEPTLTFVAADGVTIIAPNQPKAFGPRATVALISIDRYTWVLCGETSLESVE